MHNNGGFMVDNTEQDDGIIELTQVVGEDSSDASNQDVIELSDVAQEETIENDLDLDLDLDLNSDSGAFIPSLESAITQEQVDAALERVVEKKFAKIIEKSLLEVMEKVLEREIVDIRKRLQTDLDEIAIS